MYKVKENIGNIQEFVLHDNDRNHKDMEKNALIQVYLDEYYNHLEIDDKDNNNSNKNKDNNYYTDNNGTSK